MAILTTHAIESFLLDRRIRQRWQAATRRHYRSCLMRLARWLAEQQDVTHIEEVTTDHLSAFISAPQNHPTVTSNSRTSAAADGHVPAISVPQLYVTVIKVFFGWLVEEEELIPQHPALALRLPQPTTQQRIQQLFQGRILQILHPQHLEALFAACDRTTCDRTLSLGLRDYVLMLLLLLDAGRSVREVGRLTLDQIHEDHLRAAVGKGNSECEVGFCPATGMLIWKYITPHRVAANDAVQTLFTNFAGCPLDPSGVEKLLRRVRDAAGLEDVPVTAHKVRHTFLARTWLERGGEIMSLSRVMGHASVKITEIHLEDVQSRQARTHHAKYSPVSDLRLPGPGQDAGTQSIAVLTRLPPITTSGRSQGTRRDTFRQVIAAGLPRRGPWGC